MSGSIQYNACHGYSKQQFNTRHPMIVQSMNGKQRLVSSTPQVDTRKQNHQKTFDNWANQEVGGLSDQVEYMSMGEKNEFGEDSAAEMYLEFMRKRYPKTFDCFVEKSGLKKKIRRMNSIQTGAVLTDVGLSGNQLEKLEHHVRFHLGEPLFCPRDDLVVLTEDCPEPKVYLEKITHKDRSIKKIYILMHELEEYICAEMNRELGTTYKLLNRSRSHPMFSYSLLSSKVKEGIYTLLGTDHGQDFCQFAIRFLLGTPEDRHRAGCADYQTKTINFCMIKCKKDLPEILKITKDNVNNALNVLRKKRMVGIEDKHGGTKMLFFDRELEIVEIAKDMTQHDSCILKCLRKDSKVEITTKVEGLDTNGPMKHFIIINEFHNFQCGDYAAQFTLQGRHGMTSCRCMHCNLTHTEWNREECYIEKQRLLTFDDIKNGNNSDVGNSDIPSYPYDPMDCLSPILHGEIGSGNSQIDASIIPFLIDVDSATDEEYSKLSIKHELECELASLDIKIRDIVGVSKDQEIKREKVSRTELRKVLRQAKSRLKQAQESKKMNKKEERIRECTEKILEVNRVLESADGVIEDLERKNRDEKDSLREKRALLKTKLKGIDKEIEGLLSERKRSGESLVSEFHSILQKYNISVKAWHGGSLIGRHVISLLRNCDKIIGELMRVCLERAEERRERGEEMERRRIPINEEIVNRLQKQKDLFCVFVT